MNVLSYHHINNYPDPFYCGLKHRIHGITISLKYLTLKKKFLRRA